MALESYRRGHLETLDSFPMEKNNKHYLRNNKINTTQIKEEDESATDLEGQKRNNLYLEHCSADQIDTIIK